MSTEHFNYTIICPKTRRETRIVFFQDDAGHVNFALPTNVIIVDKQQLTELGWLFLSLAGDMVDHSSAMELLDGYGLNTPPSLEKLVF